MNTTIRNIVGTIVNGVIAVIYMAFMASMGKRVYSGLRKRAVETIIQWSRFYDLVLTVIYFMHALLLGVACFMYNTKLIYLIMGLGIVEIFLQILEHFHAGSIPKWWVYTIFSILTTSLWIVAHLNIKAVEPYTIYMRPLWFEGIKPLH